MGIGGMCMTMQAGIGQALAEKTGAGREASRKAAFQYVGLLTRRGLVAIEVPAGPGKKRKK